MHGFYIGSVIGLVTGDVSALLTYKSIFLTSTVVVSGGAIKGTVQGLLDNSELNTDQKNKNQGNTELQEKNDTERKTGLEEENNNQQKDTK